MTPTYHKIQSVFQRDPDNNYKTFLMGQYADPAFEYLADMPWELTEKIDGTNMRLHVGVDDGYEFGGRTERADIHKDLAAHMHEVGQRATGLDLNGLTLYGEGYGAGIQKGGGDYRPDKGFILFDVMTTKTGIFLEREDVEDIARKLDVPVVAHMGIFPLLTAVNLMAEGHREVASAIRDTEAEGWVLRPTRELRTRTGSRVITKLKVADFPSRSAEVAA